MAEPSNWRSSEIYAVVLLFVIKRCVQQALTERLALCHQLCSYWFDAGCSAGVLPSNLLASYCASDKAGALPSLLLVIIFFIFFSKSKNFQFFPKILGWKIRSDKATCRPDMPNIWSEYVKISFRLMLLATVPLNMIVVTIWWFQKSKTLIF